MRISKFIAYYTSVAKELGFKKLILLPFALIIVLMMMILSKFLKIKVHRVENDRLGHFAAHTELFYLSTINAGKKSLFPQMNIYCVASVKSANAYLEKMWRRTFLFIPGNFGWLITDLLKRMPKNQILKWGTQNDREGRLLTSLPSLTFTVNEIDSGRNFLKKLGLKEADKFVCLNVRDSSYLRETENLGWTKRHDWSHHDYRDSDINTYIDAAETLAEMGYTVFRMGKVVKEPFSSKHPRVFDYAKNGMRTEFLDIFLGAQCTFCISTGTGWDSIPMIFHRPSMYINHLPHFGVDNITRTLIIYPKTLLEQKSQNILNLSQIVERELQTRHDGHEYAKSGIELRNMSSEELVQAVTEMAERVEGKFVPTEQQKLMQEKLRHELTTNTKVQPSPGFYPIRAEYASCFLSNYPNFLD